MERDAFRREMREAEELDRRVYEANLPQRPWYDMVNESQAVMSAARRLQDPEGFARWQAQPTLDKYPVEQVDGYERNLDD